MANSKNNQALKDSTKARWPGVTVYDVGDAAHKLESSDHNPDDTSGVRASQFDSDSIPEVRATDTMIGPKFTKADAADLFEMLTTRPENQARMAYVIYNRRIRSRKDSPPWSGKPYTGSDPHTNHVHGSTWAGADNNATPFNLGATSGGIGALSQEIDGLRAILSGSGSGTLTTPNQLHVKLNTIQTTLNQILINTASKPSVDVAALAAALSDMLPEGVGLSKDDVRDALADVLTKGTDATS